MLAVAAGAERMTLAMRSLEHLFLIGVEGVAEIWLVRHGDCSEDMADEPDPPLSPLGRKQAALLAERARRLKPAAVYSSPYRRAVETAKAIADDVSVDPRLVEMAMDLTDEGMLDFKEPPLTVVERMSAAIDDTPRRIRASASSWSAMEPRLSTTSPTCSGSSLASSECCPTTRAFVS